MEPLDETVHEMPFAGQGRVHSDCYIEACKTGANIFVEVLLRRIEALEHVRGQGRGSVNFAKTHCPKGHEYSPENTYCYPNGSRGCRVCRAAASREYKRREKENLHAAS